MLRVGLNPYGLAYTFGLQGAGTPRQNPNPTGLSGLVDTAERLHVEVVEIDWRWLLPLTDDQLGGIAARLGRDRRSPIVAAWLAHQAGETLDEVFRVARAIGATFVRLHLTPVLEGGRGRLGSRWNELVAHARRTLAAEARKAADAGLSLGIENHQDFGSEELLAMADAAGSHVGIVFDTGNPFAVAEDPVAFASRVAGRVRHMHLKDYRAQFTPEGYRLVRCALGDGSVPLTEIITAVTSATTVTASLEPAALDARHIRLCTPEWWQGYGPRDPAEIGVMLDRLQHRRWPDDADARTPWERQESPDAIVEYERRQLDESVGNLEDMGILKIPESS